MSGDSFQGLLNLFRAKTKCVETRRKGERGNVFFTLFGAVAVVGVLGAGIMSTMRGPLTTMVEVNRIEETKAEMAVSLRLILLTPNGTADGDVLTEPRNAKTCASAPSGAGCIPDDVAARKTDAWGTAYAYCAWNNGSDSDPITGGAGTDPLLRGALSTNNLAVALISAGPDRQFQTQCQNAGTFVTPSSGGGDDIVRSYNYNDAVAGTDGLWELQDDAGNDIARVEEEISVGGGAGSFSQFEGGASFGDAVTSTAAIRTDLITPNTTAATPKDYIEFAGSLLLPEIGDVSCSGNEGSIAYDETEQIVSFCDGDSWEPLGKKFWIADSNGIRNNDALAAHVGIGTGSSSAFGLDVGGGLGTDTLDATGAVDFDATLNVDGATTLNNTLTVVGANATTLGGSLDVAGDTELDGTLGVDGTSEFREDATFISDVFIEKTAGGAKGTLTVQDTITATEGDITATAGNVVATAGDVIATAGNVVATAGNVEATAGDVSAGQDVIAERHVKATTGDVEAVAGNLIALGTGGKVVGKSFHRGSDGALDFSDIEACDPETEKTVWSAVSGWGCEPDNGTGSGTDGESTLQDVLSRGNDAEGQDAEDFNKIGADEYCDAGLATCVDSATLIGGSQIWKKNAGDPTKIYYNAGNVGIGTDNPDALFSVDGGEAVFNYSVDNAADVAWPENQIIVGNGAVVDGARTLIQLNTFNSNSVYATAWIGSVSESANHKSSIIFANEGAANTYAERLRINGDGNVGIGATDPKMKLDVAGTLKIGDGTELCNVTDHEGAIRYIGADDKFQVCANETTGWEDLFKSGDKGGLWDKDDAGGDFIEYDDALGGMRVGSVAGAPMREGWTFDADNFLLFTNGKAGANQYCAPDGTNCFDPGVLSAINDGAGVWLKDGPGGASGEIYYSGGNVGIGTNDPAAPLSVFANVGGVSAVFGPDTNASDIMINDINTAKWRIGTGNYGLHFRNDYDGDGTFTNQVNFGPTGFVGIGTAVPGRMLHLSAAGQPAIALSDTRVGAGNQTMGLVFDGGVALVKPGLVLQNLGDAGGFVSNSVTFFRDGSAHFGGITAPANPGDVVFDGDVGIGTNDAKTKLDVAGTVKIGDGTELCNSVDHEGGIKYDASDDEFYVCRNAADGWEPIGSGSGSGSGGSANSMVPNWPDALKCLASNGDYWIYVISHHAVGTQSGRVGYVMLDTPTTRYMSFNADGSWSSEAGGTSDCSGKSISQIVDAGGSFKFVGGGGGLPSCTSGDSLVFYDNLWYCESDIPFQFIGGNINGAVAGQLNGPGIYYNTYKGSITKTSGRWYFAVQRVSGTSIRGGWIDSSESLNSSQGTATHANHMRPTAAGDGVFYMQENGGMYSGAELFFGGTAGAPGTGTHNTDGWFYVGVDIDNSTFYVWGGDGTLLSKHTYTNSIAGRTMVPFITAFDGHSVKWDTTKVKPGTSGGGGVSPGGGDTLAGLSCTDGQVAAWNGTSSAWECADGGSAGSGGGTSMVSGWPDAIVCSQGGSEFVLYSNYNTPGTNRIYRYIQNPAASSDYWVSFSNATKSYAAHSNMGSSDCIKSISQLYADGQAFNFVGGGSGASDSLWSDSGNGYLEYSATDAGIKLQNVTGMAQAVQSLTSGMAWDPDTNTLSVGGNITYTGTITDTSDRRLKTDIENLIHYGSMLDKINAIETYSFRMKDTPGAAKEFGVMAQELEEIFPTLVHTASDEMGTKSVNYVGLIAPMIEALKEETARRSASDAKIEKLEDQVALLSKINAGQAEKASSRDLLIYLLVFGFGFMVCVVVMRKAAR